VQIILDMTANTLMCECSKVLSFVCEERQHQKTTHFILKAREGEKPS